MTLIDALNRKQGRLSTRAFARKLNVPHQTLYAAKARRRPLGLPILGAILHSFTDLEPDVLAYIKEHAPATPSQEGQVN